MLDEFSRVFSIAIEHRFFPEHQVFDPEDFKLFQDLQVDTTVLPPNEVRSVLLKIKKDVLHGQPYSEDRLAEVAYNLKKILLAEDTETFRGKYAKKVEEVDSMARQMAELKGRMSDFESKYIESEERLSAVQSAHHRFEKITLLAGWFLVVGVTLLLVNAYGSGANFLQKVVSYWVVVAAVVLPGPVGLGVFLAKGFGTKVDGGRKDSKDG